MGKENMQEDLVVLVDENDAIIGQMDKVEAHRGNAKLHRAISVFLFRKSAKKTDLLIQQRSAKKIVGAGQWANTCCGNVRPGESYEECAHRRLRDELGIRDVQLSPITKFIYQVKCNDEFSEHEMDQVFVGWFEGDVRPNPDEVQNIEWVAWRHDVSAFLQQKKMNKWAPWFLIMLEKNEVLQAIEGSVYAS